MAISTRTDEVIQADVLDELKWDTHVRPNEIGVIVKGFSIRTRLSSDQ